MAAARVSEPPGKRVDRLGDGRRQLPSRLAVEMELTLTARFPGESLLAELFKAGVAIGFEERHECDTSMPGFPFG